MFFSFLFYQFNLIGIVNYFINIIQVNVLICDVFIVVNLNFEKLMNFIVKS
jgi:hypothetical protein